MRFRLLPLAALFLAGTTTVAAQSPTLGLLGGLTSSEVTVDAEDISVTLDSRTGFAAGLSARFPLSPMLGLEIDGIYAEKGFKISDEGDSAELKLTYIDVPVLLNYQLGSGQARPFLLGGGSVSFQAGCSVGATSGDISASAECDEVVEMEQKSLDLGLTVGAGIGFNRFSVQARYTMGMADIFDDNDDSVTSKNKTIFLLAGFTF
jgi:hypothetical protein